MNKRIKKRRNELKLSQEHIANKLGITRQGYGHYETGRNEPDIDTVRKLSDILDCSIDYLYGETDQVKGSSYNPMNEINKLLNKYDIDQSGFFDIEKWEAMGPEDIKQLEDYFEFITSRAKEKNKHQD